MKIDIGDSDYRITVYSDTNFMQEKCSMIIHINENEKYLDDGVNKRSNCFGFVSNHYRHNCSDYGMFKLENIKIQMVSTE